MIALLGLGLAAGTLDFSPPIRTLLPTTPGRVVLAASAPRPPRVDGADPDGAIVLALTSAPGVRDATGAGVSGVADTELAAAIDAAARVELQGGTWLGWYQAGHANRHERSWTQALQRAHRAGKEIHASGAAATWLARWTAVPRAVVDKPSQDPHDRSLDVTVEGLGLVDGPLVGVLEPGAPTADRIVERAVTYGYTSVLLLEGDARVDCDPRARTARVRRSGEGSVLWIGLAAGTRSRERIRGARLSIPSDGDVLDLRTGALERAAPEPAAVDAATAALVERLLVGRPAAGIPPELRNVRASGDERTSRSSSGGLQACRLDFELAREAR